MTIDKFLSFWSHYNTAIIEGLVALVILLSLFLAYRSFFSKNAASDESGAGHGLDAAQLEKTLQKILENQHAHGGGKIGKSAATEDMGLDIDVNGMDSSSSPGEGVTGTVAESPAEVSQLRLSLNESHQKIETLQKQLKEALAAAEAASAGNAGAAGGGAGAAEGGMSAQEREDLSGKVRDLEARLAEYEIISEDIADLSRYREENDNLKKELEALKAGGAKAAPAAPQAPTPASAPAAPEPPSVEVPPVAPVSEVAAPSAPAEPSAADSLIDDDLMKEFAAAVEGQKNLSKAAEKAGDGSEAPKKADGETDQLMNEFENFVAKKS